MAVYKTELDRLKYDPFYAKSHGFKVLNEKVDHILDDEYSIRIIEYVYEQDSFYELFVRNNVTGEDHFIDSFLKPYFEKEISNTEKDLLDILNYEYTDGENNQIKVKIPCNLSIEHKSVEGNKWGEKKDFLLIFIKAPGTNNIIKVLTLYNIKDNAFLKVTEKEALNIFDSSIDTSYLENNGNNIVLKEDYEKRFRENIFEESNTSILPNNIIDINSFRKR